MSNLNSHDQQSHGSARDGSNQSLYDMPLGFMTSFPQATEISKEHIHDFFKKALPESEPIVHSFVRKRDDTQVTTVTLKGSSNVFLRERVEAFNKPGFDRRPLNDEAGFSASFHGLTPLYESSAEPPAFDVYFVHGLGGHAFNTWASKPDQHSHVCMWPRDILPQYLERKRSGQDELYGRFSTFGYNAAIDSKDEIEQSIPETAYSLLNAIATSRAANKRVDIPIFFVCHSLGGLVTCQAMVEILSQEKKSHRDDIDELLYDRFFHSRHGKCLVRGITFFGTPFEGSKLANIAPLVAPVTGFRTGRGSFITALKIKDRQIQAINQQFDRIRRQADNRIGLEIFYEKKKMGRWILKTMVTEKQSALSTFNDKVIQQPLQLDHRNIVKFFSESDHDFQQHVGPLLQYMIRLGLEEMCKFDTQYRELVRLGPALIRSWNTTKQQTIDSDTSDDEDGELKIEKTTQPAHALQTALSSMSFKYGPMTRVVSIFNILYDGINNSDNSSFILKQFEQVSDPIGNTCSWISHQDLYNTWETSKTNKTIFISGKEGSGKSVLAKYIINRVRQERSTSTIAYFFCQAVGKASTPANIIRHIILQLEQQSPGLLLKAIAEQNEAAFPEQFDADVLWTVFSAMCIKIQREVIVVVDGLDECLQNLKLRKRDLKGDEFPINRFLRRICALNHGNSNEMSSVEVPQTSTTRTAICILTRPNDEVDSAIATENCTIYVKEAQVQQRAARVIEAEVERLIQDGKVPRDLQQVVKKTLIEKAKLTPGSAFQWANTAIKSMQNKIGSTQDKLQAIHPGLTASYTYILRSIVRSQQPEDRIAFLFRTLFFAQEDMTNDMLDRAFEISQMLGSSNSSVEAQTVTTRALLDTAQGFVEINDTNLRLSHQSVRDFFFHLPTDEWPKFSCSNQKQGHMDMALLCLRQLLMWGGQSALETESNEKDEDLLSLLDASKQDGFLLYAAKNWSFHVRESEELSANLLSMLGLFLDPDRKPYQLAMTLKNSKDEIKSDMNLKLTPPAFTLVEANLSNTLKKVPVKEPEETLRKPRRIFPRFRRRPIEPSLISKSRLFRFVVDVDAIDSTGASLLHIAAKNGNEDIVEHLLNHGAKGKLFDSNGSTPFWWAVIRQHEKVAELLINHSQAFDKKREEVSSGTKVSQLTSLHLACHAGMGKVIQYLLDTGSDPNAECFEDRYTPLRLAAMYGNNSIFEKLVNKGAIPTVVYPKGRVVMHIAALYGQSEICKTLLKTAAVSQVDIQDLDGWTPLRFAVVRGHAETAKILVHAGATLKQDKSGWTPLHSAAGFGNDSVVQVLATKENVDIWTDNLGTPLHRAAGRGHTKVIETLLNLGADLSSACKDMRTPELENFVITPLALAIEGGHLEAVEYLLSKGAEVTNFQTAVKDSLLSMATFGRNVSIARLLMERYGLDPLHRDSNGINPFHCAFVTGQLEMAQALWDASNETTRDINTTDNFGYTPLLHATQNANMELVSFCINQSVDIFRTDSFGRDAVYILLEFAPPEPKHEIEILQKLLELGAPIDHRENRNETYLHTAAWSARSDLVSELLQKGADINAISRYGHSALHKAAMSRHEPTFKVLLDQKADITLRDDLGLTPLDYAATYSPIVSLPEAQDILKTHQPISRPNFRAKLRRRITEYVHRDLKLSPGSIRQLVEIYWVKDMAWLLAMLGDHEDDVRIALEHGIRRRADGSGSTQAICTECHQASKPAPLRLCLGCLPAFNMSCSECYGKRKESGLPRGCSEDHELIDSGGDYFKLLKHGTVREDGLTITQWQEILREEFVLHHGNEDKDDDSDDY